MDAVKTATQLAIKEALYASASVDTSCIACARTRMREENLKQNIKNYLLS